MPGAERMTIARKIAILVFTGLLGCCLVFGVALAGLAGLAPADYAAARNHVLLALLVAMVAVSGVGYWGWRAILRPLRQMHAGLLRAADALDFTEEEAVPVGNDEVGLALLAYQRLIGRLRESFLRIQHTASDLIDVTEEVDVASRKIARNSQLQSDASSNMTASMEEIAVGISLVTEQAQEASSHTEASRDVAAGCTQDIRDTVNGIQMVAERVSEAATRIKTLSEDCDSISVMANVIREIAEQTNLLALNAAIEAARAGEQGRGFAVVADEVRKLAERTAHSTREIGSLLERMQGSARFAVSSMDATEVAVNQGVASAQRAGNSIEQIQSGSVAAAGAVSEISGAIREQQVASSEIAQKIEHIAQIGEQNSVAAAASAQAIGNITQAGREIAKVLSHFRLEAGAGRVVLRVADIHGDDHPAVRALHAMSELLRQRTSGRITLKVYSGGALGTESEVSAQVRAGQIDMMRANASSLNKDCPATLVPTLPFLFRSIDHLHRAMDGKPGEQILASCAAAGLIGLCFYDSGARSIYASKPVRSLKDVRGMRLRVMQSDLWVAVANAMGAQATPMPMDEIIAGQKMGLIDAAENNIPTFDSYKQHEVFKYFSHTEHAMVPELIVFSKQRWNILTPEDQALIAAAAKDSVPLMRTYWAEREESARKNAMAAGTTFITDVDKASFQAVMNPVYERFVTSTENKALLKAIQEIR